MTTPLGRTMRQLRERRRMTITQVAQLTGIEYKLLNGLETGRVDAARIGTLRTYVQRMQLDQREIQRLGTVVLAPHGVRTGAVVVTRDRPSTKEQPTQ